MTEISRDLFLAIVCPMANEGTAAVSCVDAVLDRCREFRARRVFAILDQITQDNTREVLEEHAKKVSDLAVIWAPKNQNVVDAYVRGYREALALGSDWILEIDAGFSHQPRISRAALDATWDEIDRWTKEFYWVGGKTSIAENRS